MGFLSSWKRNWSGLKRKREGTRLLCFGFVCYYVGRDKLTFVFSILSLPKKRSHLWEDYFLKTKPQTDELFERFELTVLDLIESVEAEQERDMADKYAGVKKGGAEVSSIDDLSVNALLYTIRLMRNMCVRCEINQVFCCKNMIFLSSIDHSFYSRFFFLSPSSLHGSGIFVNPDIF